MTRDLWRLFAITKTEGVTFEMWMKMAKFDLQTSKEVLKRVLLFHLMFVFDLGLSQQKDSNTQQKNWSQIAIPFSPT